MQYNAYEKLLIEAKNSAIDTIQHNTKILSINVLLGVDLNYETIGGHQSMLMVMVSETADII